MAWVVSTVSPFKEQFFPLLRVGMLEPDGWWNRPTEQKGYQAQVHFISQVRDVAASPIFTSSLSYNGGDIMLRHGVGMDLYAGSSAGMKFRAAANGTLGSVLVRVKSEGVPLSPDVNLYCKFCSPIVPGDPPKTRLGDPAPGGTGNPLPGTLLATSDPLSYNGITGLMPGPQPPDGWTEFTFSGDQNIPIVSGQDYVYAIGGDLSGGGVVYWAFDDDRGGTPIQRLYNLPVPYVWAVWNDPIHHTGTCFANYANDDLTPTQLFSGTGFTPSFKPAAGKDLPNGYENTWGDSGYECDATIGLASLLQALVDDPRYDEAGTIVGWWVDTADPNVGAEITYKAQHWNPGYDGMALTVEYEVPTPGRVRAFAAVVSAVDALSEALPIVSGFGRIAALPAAFSEGEPLVTGSPMIAVAVSSGRGRILHAVSGRGALEEVGAGEKGLPMVSGRGVLGRVVGGVPALAPLVGGGGEILPVVGAGARILREI